MKFCKICDNMYYLKLKEDESDEMIYYCRNCNTEDTNIDLENLSIYKYTKNIENPSKHINKFIKFDPTLPRLNTIRCPNDTCKTNTDGASREVIYLRHDETNMKYMYICCVCDTNWQT